MASTVSPIHCHSRVNAQCMIKTKMILRGNACTIMESEATLTPSLLTIEEVLYYDGNNTKQIVFCYKKIKVITNSVKLFYCGRGHCRAGTAASPRSSSSDRRSATIPGHQHPLFSGFPGAIPAWPTVQRCSPALLPLHPYLQTEYRKQERSLKENYE